MRERSTKRDRQKNNYLRSDQRMRQELTRLNAVIRTIQSKVENAERVITKLEEQQRNEPLAEDSHQKQSLKEFKKELAEKEKERTAKEADIESAKVAENKRLEEEKAALDPLDATDTERIDALSQELGRLNEEQEERRKKISHLSNEFYLLMPRSEFRNCHITAIDRRHSVNKYLRIMMRYGMGICLCYIEMVCSHSLFYVSYSLAEHQIAISALMGGLLLSVTL